MFRTDLDASPFHQSLVPVAPANEDSLSGNAIDEACCDSRIDNALESALKSVPLPEGLLVRLFRLACVATDERSSQANWHGKA